MCCWGELKNLGAQSVCEVSAYYIFQDTHVEMKVSQAYN